ncbi:zinc transporter ZIP10 isoform X1 [Megalops cyprinoides]|uniref:zinc transporter ZIP10 isoform X1 n=1 Tax=Megalops cyprinoides TaxID=118141 RepID=UPI001863DF58|nr:zinc transporter ZIP10 isoform X1 [Megalops cyprinoides]XP_036390177.1 zinc transporter ZIP10 isoform X1 [Megalops cyprinoides]
MTVAWSGRMVFWLCVLIALCFEINTSWSLQVAVHAAEVDKQQWNEKPGIFNSSKAEHLGLEHLEEAFEEQGYYLQRLFLQYGENGTLTFGGLQKLLGSLGLGEVSVLEISHQGLRQTSLSSQHLHAHESQPPHPESSWQDGTVWEKRTADNTKNAHTSGGPLTGVNEGVDHPGLPSVPHLQPGQRQFGKPSLVLDHPMKNHLHGNCLNVSQLLWNFGLGKASHITPAHFTFLCPALLYQIDSGVCLRHPEGRGQEAGRGESFLKALGWGSLALVVISLPSLLALGLIPLLPPARLHTLLCPMAALAVGTLCGDALLHLLPHTRPGLHSESEQRDSVLKGLSVLGGLYLLFLVESILGLRRHSKRRVKRKQKGSSSADRDGDPEKELTALEGTTPLEETQHSDDLNTVEHGHGHSHSHPAQGNAGMGSLVWMVVMGDGIHNLTDGLAIGAAFSQSLAGGLSTTVAVFCHELPHELGDLAVLLGAGWPVRRLLLFSGISAALGLVGLLGGAVLGHHSASLSPWILALTAGVFLYVALADIVPEMLHGDPGPTRPLTRFLLQNLGLLTGGGIMLCIALFEEDIAFNLGDV